jgi:hypothetical protein
MKITAVIKNTTLVKYLIKYNCNCTKIKYVPVKKITTLTVITITSQTVIKITTVTVKITTVKDNYIKNYNCKRQLY